MARISEGVVKGSPTLDDLLASLGSSAVEWRKGPEMNMDEMNERSNAKAFLRGFALVRTKHAAFSHMQQKARSMFAMFISEGILVRQLLGQPCRESGPFITPLKLDVCYA